MLDGVLRLLYVLEVLDGWMVLDGVRDVLPTFETVVMYGHFDGDRSAWCYQIVEIKPKIPVFYME